MTGYWRGRLAYCIAHLTLRRFVVSVQLRTPAYVGADGQSVIVVANHESVLDVALAVEISVRLGYQFATWAHSEVIRRVPALRRFGAIEAAPSPHAVARLMAQTRELMRQAGPPVMLWIFPEGRFGHRMAPIKPLAGAVVAAATCGQVAVLACGVDYTVFRRFRPHASVVLTDGLRTGLSVPGLAHAMETARSDAAELSRHRLPQQPPVFFLHPAGWRAGRRARAPWFHHWEAHQENMGELPVRHSPAKVSR